MNPLLRHTWLLSRVEALRYLRTPQVLLLAVAPALAMALLVWALTLNVTQEPVALVVLDHSPSAERLLEILVSDTDAYRLTVTDAGTARSLLMSQRVAAIITIPAGFLNADGNGQVQVRLDLNNVDLDFSDDIRRSLDRSVGIYNGLPLDRDDDDDQETASALASAHAPASSAGADDARTQVPARLPAAGSAAGANPYLVSVEEHDERQTDVSFLAYELVPVIILLVLNIGILGPTCFGARDAVSGIGEAWRTCPVSPWATALARILVAACIATALSVAVVLAIRALHLGVTTIPRPGLLLATLALAALAAAVLGTLIGQLPLAPRVLGLGAMVVSTVLFLLGGAFCTVAMLPPWLRLLSTLDPLRGAIDGLRYALFYPASGGWAEMLPSLLALGGAGLIALVLTTGRSSRRTGARIH